MLPYLCHMLTLICCMSKQLCQLNNKRPMGKHCSPKKTLKKKKKNCQCIFCYFIIISPWIKAKSPSLKDALCPVWQKLAPWFWRRKFLNFIVYLLICNYLPLEKGRTLHLYKLESPSPKGALCLVWLKLARWLWRRRFFKFR